MIDISAQRGTHTDLNTALFQLDALVASIISEAEMYKNLPGMLADVERYTANAGYYVQTVIATASETNDPLRHIIVQLHRDINAANSAIEVGNWLRGKSEGETRDADARIMVYMLVLRKARMLAGMLGTLPAA